MEKTHKNTGGIIPRKVSFICKKCGYKFELETYSKEEVKERNSRLIPPECPRCHSLELERRS